MGAKRRRCSSFLFHRQHAATQMRAAVSSCRWVANTSTPCGPLLPTTRTTGVFEAFRSARHGLGLHRCLQRGAPTRRSRVGTSWTVIGGGKGAGAVTDLTVAGFGERWAPSASAWGCPRRMTDTDTSSVTVLGRCWVVPARLVAISVHRTSGKNTVAERCRSRQGWPNPVSLGFRMADGRPSRVTG